MKRILVAFFIVASLYTAQPVHAEEYKPDDMVVFDLSAENWVNTNSARVVLNIEAAVTDKSSGAMRDNMAKAVKTVVKAEWRLTSFNRSQDQTGMERWSAQYEARLPEKDLNGLMESAKKTSKAGMQITIGMIDFAPTLAETQKTLSQTREDIYAQAKEQLNALNKAMQGRNYRVASIDFTGQMSVPAQNNVRDGRLMATMAKAAHYDNESFSGSMEKSEKVTVTARVVLAAQPSLTK